MKHAKGYKADTDLTADDLVELIAILKKKVQDVLRKPFPENAMEQLGGAIGAVFQSWNGKRAISYRRIEGIPDEWGTAERPINGVCNMGDTSATVLAYP
jgi:pyruvate,orthophosphate dikinase